MTKPIVFLHIPKTAGQTVHNEIARNLSEGAVSPIRVHHQSGGDTQYPEGYKFYSGHLDWPSKEDFSTAPYMFTILRDPRERIASFYFYLLKEAEKLDKAQLSRPENTGKHMILTHSADDYFLGGDAEWQRFVRDHFDNTYCRFMAGGKLRGWSATNRLSNRILVARAQSGCARLDAVYHVDALQGLEQDLERLFGFETRLVGNFHNAGAQPKRLPRWPMLMKRLESRNARLRLEEFVSLDLDLLDRLDLRRAA